VGIEIFMKIEKQTYRIIFKGKRFSFPLYVSKKAMAREKVLVRKNPAARESYLNLKS